MLTSHISCDFMQRTDVVLKIVRGTDCTVFIRCKMTGSKSSLIFQLKCVFLSLEYNVNIPCCTAQLWFLPCAYFKIKTKKSTFSEFVNNKFRLKLPNMCVSYCAVIFSVFYYFHSYFKIHPNSISNLQDHSFPIPFEIEYEPLILNEKSWSEKQKPEEEKEEK